MEILIRATYNYRHGDLSRLTLFEQKVGDIDWSGLDLSAQNLTDVIFRGSFAGAKFDDAVISGAKLGDARGLTADQIEDSPANGTSTIVARPMNDS